MRYKVYLNLVISVELLCDYQASNGLVLIGAGLSMQ